LTIGPPWNCSGQGYAGRGAKEAEIAAGRAKGRLFGCEGHVACGDQLTAGGGGQAVHGGDDRNVKPHHIQHEGGTFGENAFVVFSPFFSGHFLKLTFPLKILY
jgi:hypothetical protein